MPITVVAVPTFDLGQSVVDQPVDDRLSVVWQVPLTGFHTRATRLDSVAGAAVMISPEHGVLTPGAAPPDLGADVWPVPVRVAGSAAAGQMMVADQSDMVYRLSPGRTPEPVWRMESCHPKVGVVGLPGGRLLWSCDDESGGEPCDRTALVDEADGRVVWTRRVMLAPTLVVGDRLIGYDYGSPEGLRSLDAGTGEEQWRDDLRRVKSLAAVVGDRLWAFNSRSRPGSGLGDEMIAVDVRTGKPAGTVPLPRRSRRTGLLDQSGRLHIIDEDGWAIVDLVEGVLVADAPFEAPGMDSVYGSRSVRAADGRLVLADGRGQVFVVHPDRPTKPELVATCPDIQGIGLSAGRVILMSYDGTLTALGTP